MKVIKLSLSLLLLILTLTMAAQNTVSKKYNRKIVFSKSEIITGQENESAFISEYKPGEPLYYKLFMDSTIKQFLEKWRHAKSAPSTFKFFYTKYYIDDVYTSGYKIDLSTLTDDQFMNTSTFGAALSGGSGSDPYKMDERFKEFLGTAGDKLNGKHKIKIEVFMYDKYHVYEMFGSGTLDINGEGGNMAANAAGIKDEFHQKHLRKIVFGSKPLGAELKESDVISDYTVGQPLYYRIFMDNTMKNYISKHYKNTYALSFFHNVYVKFYLDGQLAKIDELSNRGSITFTDNEMMTLTNYGGYVFVSKRDEKEKQSLMPVFEKLLFTHNKSLSGTHKLKMEVYLYSQGLNQTVEMLGEGELNIHLTTINHSDPELCFKPTAAASDPDLEAKFVSAYNKDNPGAVAKKAWLKYTNWDVRKNELTGAILNKYRNATLLVQTAEGNCSYMEATFAMDYEGNGKYGYIHFSGLVPGTYRPILCECLK